MADPLAPRTRLLFWAPLVAVTAVILLGITLFAGVMQLEETDSFCGSCHTQPEVLYLERMARAQESAAPVDSASAHQSRRGEALNIHCIDCHSGAGLPGRVLGVLEGAGNALRYISGTMVQPAKQHGALPDVNCIKCHADVIAADDYKGKENHHHSLLARWRKERPDIAAACVECHPGHNDTADPANYFIVAKKSDAACTRCHTTIRRE